MVESMVECPLCRGDGGETLWRDQRLRIVLPDEPLYPGFTRVIWNAHVAELSDLAHHDRQYLFETVVRVERLMRAELAPDKINLASLGNQVPHLHWHVIARWRDDAHYPAPVWASVVAGRESTALGRRKRVAALLGGYRAALLREFSGHSPAGG